MTDQGRERKRVRIRELRARLSWVVGIQVVLSSLLLAMAGASVAYVLVAPGALGFMGQFVVRAADPRLTGDVYADFALIHFVVMVALFQLPLLLFIAYRVYSPAPSTLLRLQKWVIGATLLVAALIRPMPDPINLALVTVPVVAVYELGVFAIWWHHRQDVRPVQEVTRPVIQLQPVPIPVITDPEPELPPRPALPEIVATSARMASSTPLPARAATPLPIPTRVRSVDGVSVQPRSVPTSTPLRPRPIIPVRQMSQLSPARRVSIDGLSMI